MRRRLLALAVLSAAALAYVNTLSMGFTWDDEWLILNNPRIDDPSYVRHLLFERKLWRPVKRISLMVDHALWGRSRPGGFHLTNVALHALASLALYHVILGLGAGERIAFLSALLFALHPIHVEAVANISHRKEPLALVFYLLAFLAYLRARRPPAAAGTAARAGWLVACGALYLLAMLSKEAAAVMFPAMIVVSELTVSSSEPERRRWLTNPGALAVAPVLGLFYARGYLGGLSRRFRAEHIEWVTAGRTSDYSDLALAASKSFAESTALLVWPWPLYLDRAFTLPGRLLEPTVAAGIALAALAIGVVVASRRRAPLVCFAASWYLLNYLPVSNLIPLTRWLIAERFLYVPSVGFTVLLGIALDRLIRRRTEVGWCVAAALAACYFGATVHQNRVWRSQETLWTHTLTYNPTSPRALHGLGLERERSGALDEAEALYARAVEYHPEYHKTQYGLALLLFKRGRPEAALAPATTATELDDESSDSFQVLGSVRYKLKDYAAARAAFERAIELEPESAGALVGLARCRIAERRFGDAVGLLQRALAGGETAEIRYLQGLALELDRRWAGALAAYARAVELSPDDGAAAARLYRLRSALAATSSP